MDRKALIAKKLRRLKKKRAIRAKVSGTPDRPRLVVYRSNRHIYAQLVDDTQGKVLLGTSDLSPDVRQALSEKSTKTDASKVVGKVIAEKAMERKYKRVVFDRNGFKYHGRVQALADAAREAGLEF